MMLKPLEIWIVVGTRPNFIKVTQFKSQVKDFPNLSVKIIHTGQHYDAQMAEVFFDQFGIQPDYNLHVKPGHPGLQIAETIAALVALFLENKPDMVIAVGDVNSTLAAAIAANKCGIPVAHLESGLRSNDPTMPEEHNRKVADTLAQLHFITEDAGLVNLRNEHAAERGLAMVGNTMIDTLVAFRKQIETSTILDDLQIGDKEYALVTLHRPSNVDSVEALSQTLDVLEMLARYVNVAFPVHPRTRARMKDFGIEDRLSSMAKVHTSPPLGYFDFQKLIYHSAFVLTDSGGIQEETTFLQKPCLTLRPNTERPVTIEMGSNVLLPFDIPSIEKLVVSIRSGRFKKGLIPPLWDGFATRRVLDRISLFFDQGF